MRECTRVMPITTIYEVVCPEFLCSHRFDMANSLRLVIYDDG
jgi:hypothetical protein